MTAPESDLSGRTALVTGATRGIGRAAVEALRARGARVGLVARGREELDHVARATEGCSLACDVSDDEAVSDLPRRFRAWAGGPPDVLVCAAGTFALGPAAELTGEELDRQLTVNLRGSALTVRAFLPELLERGSGVVIHVGSVAGRKPLPGNAAYAASKYGLRGFHEVLLEELRGTGVRASLLEPAATDTPLWDPLDPDGETVLPDRKEMLRPADVAEAVAFVATRPEGVQIPFLPIERA